MPCQPGTPSNNTSTERQIKRGNDAEKLRGYLLPFFRGKQKRERNWKTFRVELAKTLKKAEKVATLCNECAVSISFIAKMFISSFSWK